MTVFFAIFDQGRISKDPELQSQADRAIQNLRKLQAGEVTAGEIFDLERMATYLALVALWDADHNLVENNYRLYYNPISGLLEPVGFDGVPSRRATRVDLLFNLRGWSDLLETVLDDPAISALFIRELERVSSDAYLVELKEHMAQKTAESLTILQSEFPGIDSIWPKITARQKILSKLISPSIAGIAYGTIQEKSNESFSIALFALFN